MESTGALAIWKRSVSKNKLRYTWMVSDGDSKTFKLLSDQLPYGASNLLSKHECVGHVKKRMGTALREKAKEKFVNERVSEALVAETVPETLTKEKQKLIINTSSCEQDSCESVGCGLQPNRSKATDNGKQVDNLEELDIKEHVNNVQNSPDVEIPETSGQVSYLSGSQSNQEMMMNDEVTGNETAGEL